MQMKKILFVITKSNFGGAQKYVFELATSLPKSEYETAVALGGTGASGAVAGALAERLTEAGIRTIFIPSFERNLAWTKELRVLFDIIGLYKKERPDVVHLNSSKAGGIGAFAARLTGVPKIVFTLHGAPFAEERPLIQRLAITLATLATILLSHTTIVITKKEFDHLSSWPGAARKLRLIYNGIDPQMVFGEGNVIRSAFPRGSFIVGTIAELHPNKGLSHLIEAAAKTTDPNVRFALVGEGEERSRLESEIARLGLQEKVKLFGFQKATDVLKGFDLFVLPSIKEGLPYVLLEAGAAKLAVIASNVGGIPEIIEHQKTGLLVSPKDPTDLAAAVDDLLIHPEKRIRFADELHKKVTQNFSLDQTLTATKHVY